MDYQSLQLYKLYFVTDFIINRIPISIIKSGAKREINAGT